MADKLNIPALAWCLPGFLFQCFGLFAGVVPLGIVGTVFLVLGLAHYVRGKGYAPGWALWGIVPIMGPLLLILQPAQSRITRRDVLDGMIIEEDPRIHPSPPEGKKRIFGGIPLLAAMIPVGLFLVLMSPSLSHLGRDEGGRMKDEEVAKIAGDDGAAGHPSAPILHPSETEEETPAEDTGAAVEDAAAFPPIAPAAVPPSPDTKTTLLEAQFKQIHEGMTYDEVVKVVGDDSVLVSDGPGGTKLVKWAYSDGSFFTAKFQNDVLERTTQFHVRRKPAGASPPEKKEPVPAIPQAGRQDAGATADTMQGLETPVWDDSAEMEMQAEEEDLLAQMYEQMMYEEEAEEELAAPSGRVVRISQTPRNAGRSASKKAQLPRFSRAISRGPHDVNIRNTFSYDVKVGLRTGSKRGKDFSIPANGVATVYLPNDTYYLYYLDAETPDTLDHSGSFTVASPPFSIHLSLR